MTDIHIERRHALGLVRAREVAHAWVEQVERRFGLSCRYGAGKRGDRVEFSGAGVAGTAEVGPDRFALHAQLSFPFDAFSAMIEERLARNLDELLQG